MEILTRVFGGFLRRKIERELGEKLREKFGANAGVAVRNLRVKFGGFSPRLRVEFELGGEVFGWRDCGDAGGAGDFSGAGRAENSVGANDFGGAGRAEFSASGELAIFSREFNADFSAKTADLSGLCASFSSDFGAKLNGDFGANLAGNAAGSWRDFTLNAHGQITRESLQIAAPAAQNPAQDLTKNSAQIPAQNHAPAAQNPAQNPAICNFSLTAKNIDLTPTTAPRELRADYELKVPDLSAFEALLNFKLRGEFSGAGELILAQNSRENEAQNSRENPALRATLGGEIFGGQLAASLAGGEFSATIAKCRAERLLWAVGAAEFYAGVADVKARGRLGGKGAARAVLAQGQLAQSDFSRKVLAFCGQDITRLAFTDGWLRADWGGADFGEFLDETDNEMYANSNLGGEIIAEIVNESGVNSNLPQTSGENPAQNSAAAQNNNPATQNLAPSNNSAANAVRFSCQLNSPLGTAGVAGGKFAPNSDEIDIPLRLELGQIDVGVRIGGTTKKPIFSDFRSEFLRQKAAQAAAAARQASENIGKLASGAAGFLRGVFGKRLK